MVSKSKVSTAKDCRVAAALAFAGVLIPGLHKFYLGQTRWGMLYLLLGWSTPISRFASAAEGIWYLCQDRAEFDRNFNSSSTVQSDAIAMAAVSEPAQIELVAKALRQLEQLRQEGLISESEFEQKRRQLVDVRAETRSTNLGAKIGVKIDVNRSSVDDWLHLGLSIHQAQLLVSLNRVGVSFHCLEDVARALSLPIDQLQPFAPNLLFCYYEPDSLNDTRPLSLNLASLEQLKQVPGMDGSLAEAIVHHREQQGAYRNLIDLQARLQLPSQVITELMHFLSVS